MKRLASLLLFLGVFSMVGWCQTITTTPFSGTFCGGSAIPVSYTITGTFNTTNVFQVQLSSPTGSFTSGTTLIGSSSGNTSGTITAMIPTGIATGTGYRIRVRSTSPARNGSNNGSNLTLGPGVVPSVAIAASQTGTICPGATVTFTAAPLNGGATPTYQWTVNGISAGTNSSTFTTNSLANGDQVRVRMTSNAPCPSPVMVFSNQLTMNVGDAQAPTIFCPANITVNATPGQCGAIVNYTLPTASDNCSQAGALSGFTLLGTSNGLFYYVSNNTATWTNANNAAVAAGGQLATVRNASQNTWLRNAVTAAGVGGFLLGFNDVTNEGSFGWSGGAEVTYTNWAAGEPNNSGNEDATQMLSNGMWNDVSVGTNLRYVIEIGGLNVSRTSGPASGTFFPVGTTTVTHAATDANGNTSNCSFTVTVTDNIAPTVLCPASAFIDLDGVCNGVVGNYIGLATISDNCTPTGNLIIAQSPAAGTPVFGRGAMSVTLTATDLAGNVGSCSFSVMKRDVTPPAITCPSNIVVGSNNGICGATVVYNATVTDACHASGCNMGTLAGYTLIGSINDHSYYRSTAAMSWAAANAAAQALGGHLVTISSAAENNLFSGIGQHWLGFTDQLAEGQWAWVTGEPVVYTNWGAGEPNNSGNEDFAVINWNGTTWNDAGASSLPFIVEFDCITVQVTQGLASGSVFPIGTTTVTLTARDMSGNLSAPCSFTVTVNDTSLPTLSCPSNIIVNAPAGTCSALVSYPVPVVTENCGTCTVAPAISGFTSLGLFNGKAYYVSQNSVNYAAARAQAIANGGTLVSIANADENTFIRSGATAAGVGNAWIGFTDELVEGTFVWDNGQSVNYTNWNTGEPNNSGNSDFAQLLTTGFWNDVSGTTVQRFIMVRGCLSATRTAGLASGSAFPVGLTNVTHGFTDAFGNTSSCTFTVRVNDVTPPSLACPGNQVMNVGTTCNGVLPDYRGMAVVSDNCTASNAISLSQSPAPGTLLTGTGSTTVTLTATDAAGNISNCNFSVTRTATPSITIASNIGTTVCVGAPVTFTATAVNVGSAPVYQWRVNGAVTGTNSATFTTSSLVNGNTVQCRVTSSAPCSSGGQFSSNTITMTVSASIPTSVTIAANPGSNVCSGSVVIFTASPVNQGLSPVYQWRVNGSIVGSNMNTFTTSLLNNGDVVTCRMTSSLVCASPSPAVSNSITMNVQALVVPAVTISTSSTSVCSGNNVTFNAVPQNGGTLPVYQWRVNNQSAGTNSATFSSSTLTTGSVVTCRITSNAGCLSANNVLSNTIHMSVTPSVVPAVTVNAEIAGNPCSNAQVTLTAAAMHPGSSPSYQWRRNGVPFGPNSATFTTNALGNGDEISCVLTSNQGCASPAVVGSNNTIVSLGAATLFYLDADGDGFGSNAQTMAACSMPNGYAALGGDCDDTNADINPAMDEWSNGEDDNCDGSVDEDATAVLYFRDNDGDGFGDPNAAVESFYWLPGYVLNNTDCNDAFATVYPGAQDICTDALDNDCDGLVNEGCNPINDFKEFALVLQVSPNGQCLSQGGSLAGATVSAEALSVCPSGNDVWYYFTAPEPGIMIKVTNSNDDILLELQDNDGQLIKQENAVSTAGDEFVNFSGLVPGNTYWLAVRNYNTAVSPGGSFSLCAQVLWDSYLNAAIAGNISFCQMLSALPVNPSQYIYVLKKINSTEEIQFSSTSASLVLQQIPGVEFGESYEVSVDAIYLCLRADGTTELIRVVGTESRIVHVNQHNLLNLRQSDACPNVRQMNSVIGAQGFVCGAIGYEWEFKMVSPLEGPVVSMTTGMAGNLINLSNVQAIAGVGQYITRLRPLFPEGIAGNFGAWVCLQIVAPAGTIAEEETIAINSFEPAAAPSLGMRLHPNPSAGTTELSVTGELPDAARVEVYSPIGQLVHTSLLTSATHLITLQDNLPSGVYLVKINDGIVTDFKRWLIQR
jgi:hypothetical protein